MYLHVRGAVPVFTLSRAVWGVHWKPFLRSLVPALVRIPSSLDTDLHRDARQISVRAVRSCLLRV